MKKMTSFMKKIWNDESGQGATEYIILLVVIVALAMLFKREITTMVTERLAALSEGLSTFTAQ